MQPDIDDLDRMHRLHVLAPLQLTHAALSGMVARDAGAIINVASVASFLMAAGSVGYAATKSWLHVFSEGIYLELRISRSKVRIQSLCPGYTVTEFHDVIGMNRALIPKFLWLDARFVVRESLQALERNDLLVIPSWKYRPHCAGGEAIAKTSSLRPLPRGWAEERGVIDEQTGRPCERATCRPKGQAVHYRDEMGDP